MTLIDATHSHADGPDHRTWSPTGAAIAIRRVVTPRLAWSGLGFALGIAFWHFVSFWSFVSAIVLSGPHHPAADVPARRLVTSLEQATGGIASSGDTARTQCTELRLDRATGATDRVVCNRTQPEPRLVASSARSDRRLPIDFVDGARLANGQ